MAAAGCAMRCGRTVPLADAGTWFFRGLRRRVPTSRLASSKASDPVSGHWNRSV